MPSTLEAIYDSVHTPESTLHKMVFSALLIAVNYVRAEAATTAHHAARLQWASTICGGDTLPTPTQDRVREYVLIACANSDVVAALPIINDGSTAHEDLVKYIVNYQLALI